MDLNDERLICFVLKFIFTIMCDSSYIKFSI